LKTPPIYSLLFLCIISDTLNADTQIELDEIVVTSQRREELLQDVPITINSFNNEFIQTIGAQSLADIDKFSPGLEVIDSSKTNPKFKIRGIGTLDFGIGVDPAVSVYQDDVYIGAMGGALLQFSDIERVEVLKGPQGTLFGRNSAAGAIHIISHKPVNQLSASLRTRIGNHDKTLVEGMVNTPLIDNVLLLRVNGLYNQRDGFINNTEGGEDFSDEGYQAGRASLLWHVNQNTQLQYSFEVNHINQQAPVAIGLNSTLSPSGGKVTGAVANDVIGSKEKRFLHAHNLNIQHDFSWAKMTWISSYRQFDVSAREDEDGIAERYAYLDSENSKGYQQFSQELRFNGSGTHLDWVGGLYYSYEKGTQELKLTTFTNTWNALAQKSLPAAPIANAPFPDNILWQESMKNRLTAHSLAAFADITWAMTEQLELTLGVRHTRDYKTFGWRNESNTTGLSTDLLYPVSAYPAAYKNKWINADNNWHDTSPRAVLTYHWTEQLMSFFSYSQGYKAGGFNSQQTLSSFDPETVESFEGGVKSSWFNQQLQGNISIFHYNYEDKQDISFEKNGGGVGQYVTRTGNAEANGGEVELRWLAMESLKLGVNYSYLDAKWTKRQLQSINFNTAKTETMDISGESLLSPKHHLIATLDYHYGMNAYGDLAFHADHSFASKRQFNRADADYYYDYHNRDSAQHFTNLRLSWQHSNKQLQLALWVENIADNHYSEVVVPVTASTLGTAYVDVYKPRLWGMEMILNF